MTKMLSGIKQFILDYIESGKEIYFDLEKQVWEKPELGMEEHFASKLYTDFLEANGFEVERGSAGMPTAFIAVWGSEKPVIGFSMEYDALPGLSQKVQTKKEAKVPKAPGQGCGHNLIGAGGAFAALAFKAAAEKFNIKCTIKIFGTPAEELCIGKPVMGNAGLFRGVDIFLDWHPWSVSGAQYKTCPAYFNVKFHYKGRTAHGNSPWHGRSAMDAAILQAHAIEMLREHITPGPGPLAANTINYTFSDTGPEFASVVPDRATLWCVGRFETSKQLADALERVKKTAEGSAIATGTTVETEYITASHEMIPNVAAHRVVHDNLILLGDIEFTEEEKRFVLDMQKEEGQETYWKEGIEPFDFSYFAVTDSAEYSWEGPYAQLSIKLGPGPGWHNWMVTACGGNTHGQKSIVKAAQILAASAVDFALDEKLVEDAETEWRESLGGRVYKSLLPEGTPVPLAINKDTMEKYR
ncbi:MAG TPA: amidohydrolase [Anaerovoracaceae bacterium]|nr:amidohydrolase [Anaerovoracaceae bacterium]